MGTVVQRLFSTFPDGWPGTGLLFLRAIAIIPSVQHGIAGLITAALPVLAAHFVAACASALLLFGFWTPAAGILMALAELAAPERRERLYRGLVWMAKMDLVRIAPPAIVSENSEP